MAGLIADDRGAAASVSRGPCDIKVASMAGATPALDLHQVRLMKVDFPMNDCWLICGGRSPLARSGDVGT
jgi:hypothetical protein